MWPVTLEPPVTATSRTWPACWRRSRSKCASSRDPEASAPTCRTSARARQGRSLLWCSMSETSTMSPAERQPVGGLVDRLGGVLAEDHDVVAGVAADEA